MLTSLKKGGRMRKGLFFIVSCLVIGLIFTPCAWSKTKTIKIGINAPMTGDIPKVGEGSKFAAEMWLEDIKAAGGLEVGGKKYPDLRSEERSILLKWSSKITSPKRNPLSR